LKITPAGDFGAVMAQPVEATTYHWKWYYSVPGFALWLVLILALVLPKANRDLRALLILASLVLVNLAWLSVERITGMSSSSATQFGTVLQSMAVGTAVLWLVAGYFTGFRGLIRCLLAFGTVVLVAACGILSYSARLSNETALFMVFFVFLTAIFVTALAVTRAVCRRRCGPRRFMLWLALWTLVTGMPGTVGFVISGHMILSSDLSMIRLSEFLLAIFLVGPILSLGLYLLNPPFMVLGFANPFFRERLEGCLRLKPAAATAEPSTGDDIAE